MATATKGISTIKYPKGLQHCDVLVASLTQPCLSIRNGMWVICCSECYRIIHWTKVVAVRKAPTRVSKFANKKRTDIDF